MSSRLFKLIAVAITLFSISSSAYSRTTSQAPVAKKKLDALETALYYTVYYSQTSDPAKGRVDGEWRIYSKLNGSYFGDEADSFLTAQQMVILSEVNRNVGLPGFAHIQRLVNPNLQSYIADAARLGDPAGTIAYFPIIDATTGRRGLNVPITQAVPSFNVPDDLDSSSALAMYYEASGQGSDYLASYKNAIGEYRDVNRTVEHQHDRQWKTANSGAFLTWADGDMVNDSKSRIFEGVNDVDCVVNLNVIAAASKLGGLPATTREGLASSCQLMNETVENGHFGSCALWYDRPSQFWYSYARAVQSGATCLNSSLTTAKQNVLSEASALLLEPVALRANRVTQTAEILIALKKLIPVHSRTQDVNEIIQGLDSQLRELTELKGDYAYPMTEDSLFLARGFGMRLDWYSNPYSAAAELLALTLP